VEPAVYEQPFRGPVWRQRNGNSRRPDRRYLTNNLCGR